MSEIITEIWRPIDGFYGYEVSNFGRIKSHMKGDDRILKPIVDKDGYLVIGLHTDGKRIAKRIHRLVGMAFIPNPNNKSCINHIDYNRSNNFVGNLEWVTPKENSIHSSCNHPKELNKPNSTGERYLVCIKKNNRYSVRVKCKNYGTYETIEEAIQVRNKVLNGEMSNYKKSTTRKKKTNTGEHHISKNKKGYYNVQYKKDSVIKSRAFKDLENAIKFRNEIYEEPLTGRN